MTLVSILIPAYNSQNFIEETLQCCIDQSYHDIEIVVVDDGSTDCTLAIARNWEEKYDNIHVYTQKNSGACVARNLAFDKSKGEYVMFLDADDIINRDKVKSQMSQLTDCCSDMAVATCKWDRFHKSITESVFPEQTTYKEYENGFELLLDLWTKAEMFGASCYLMSRKLALKAGRWAVGLKKNQDGEYFSRVLINASKVLFCPEARLYYRTGDYDSVSKESSKAKIMALLDSFIMYKKNALAHEDSKRVRKALANNFSLFMYLYYGKYPDLSSKAKAEIKSMGLSPLPAGTRQTKIISRMIGLENFLRLRMFVKKY